MIFLQTQRLTLRTLEEKDAPVLFDYRNEESCARYQRGRLKNLDEIRNMIEKHKEDRICESEEFRIALALRDTDELVGDILVMPNQGCISLGYTVSCRYHRKGYAFEALSALIQQLHERYPDWEFISFTEPNNAASMALLRKLGYSHLGYSERVQSEVFGKWAKEGDL